MKADIFLEAVGGDGYGGAGGVVAQVRKVDCSGEDLRLDFGEL